MIKITIATMLLLPCVAAVAQQTVIIKGTVQGDTQGYDKVYFFGKDVKSDSTLIKDGHFSITLPFEKPGFQQLSLEYTAKHRSGMALFGVLMEKPGIINIDDIDLQQGIQSGKISGMKSAEEFEEIQKEILKATTPLYSGGGMRMATSMAPSSPGASGNTKTVAATPAGNTGTVRATAPMRASMTSAMGNANTPERQHQDSLRKAAIGDVLEKFISAHPDSYAAAYILDGTGRWELSTSQVAHLYELFSPAIQQSDVGTHTAAYLVGIKSSTVGNTVEDFTLNTPNGSPLSLGSLKGKYVLIDFWASWCGPCKASFPHMKEVYSKFKGDKFEIYSISIDKDKDAWLKESKKQALPWLQTLDTKNVSQSAFAVTAVPTTILIDPQGKIVMKGIGFDADGSSQLEKKLEELFGK